MPRPRFELAITALLIAACTSTAPPEPSVAVIGNAADIERWSGSWSGTVTGPQGTAPLAFTITPRRGGGGEVLFTTLSVPVELLYVRIDGMSFASAARPQFDETCRCEVYRTLHGQLAGDTISGEIQRLENRNRIVTATFTATRVGAAGRAP